MFYSDFWLQPLQNWGFELFFDQFCEIQAHPNLDGIPKKQKTNKPKKQTPPKKKPHKMQPTSKNQ